MTSTRILKRAALCLAVGALVFLQLTPELYAQVRSDSTATPDLGISVGTAPVLIVQDDRPGRMLLLSAQALIPVRPRGRMLVEIEFTPPSNANKDRGGQYADEYAIQQIAWPSEKTVLRVHYLKVSTGVLAPILDTPERVLETGFLFGLISHRESWNYTWGSLPVNQTRPLPYPNHKELQVMAEMRLRLTLGDIKPKVAFELSWLKRIARIRLDDHTAHHDYPSGIRLCLTFIPRLERSFHGNGY